MTVKVIPMQRLIDVAAGWGRPIGHDGVAAPTDIAEMMPPQCGCDGSGVMPVMFNGTAIATVPCPACADG